MQFISVFNYGVIEMAKNHIKSLREHGITNHCSFVTDEESFNEFTKLEYPVYHIRKSGTKQENFDFGTMDFNNMSFLRYYVIDTLLQQGMDVWYLDVDTVVLKNITPIYLDLKQNHKYDVCFQDDMNMLCTGCMLLFATDKTKHFVKTVIHNKTDQTNDQILVNAIFKKEPDIISHVAFSHFIFPNGVMFFGNDFVNVPGFLEEVKKEYINTPKDTYLVHANWMVGDETKTKALKQYGLWKI